MIARNYKRALQLIQIYHNDNNAKVPNWNKIAFKSYTTAITNFVEHAKNDNATIDKFIKDIEKPLYYDLSDNAKIDMICKKIATYNKLAINAYGLVEHETPFANLVVNSMTVLKTESVFKPREIEYILNYMLYLLFDQKDTDETERKINELCTFYQQKRTECIFLDDHDAEIAEYFTDCSSQVAILRVILDFAHRENRFSSDMSVRIVALV